jgi:hypothetical protein
MSQGPRVVPPHTLIGNGWLHEAPQNVRAAARKRWFNLPRVFSMPPELLLPKPPPAALAPAPTPAPSAIVASRPAPPRQRDAARREPRAPWWDEPIVVGALLFLAPPIGLAALWASRHYGRDARWAMTAVTGLALCFVAAVAMVAVR